jgi:hypothetical protein
MKETEKEQQYFLLTYKARHILFDFKHLPVSFDPSHPVA